MFSSCFLASPMQDHHMRLSEPSQTHPPPIHCFPTGNTRLKTLIHALFPLRLNASKTELIMGQPYTLGCHVGEPVEIKSCSWQFRSGPRIPFNPSEQPSEGTISQNSKSCNLTLNVLTIEHMGTWSCRWSDIVWWCDLAIGNSCDYDFQAKDDNFENPVFQDQPLRQQAVAGSEDRGVSIDISSKH